MKIRITKNGFLICPECGERTKVKIIPGVTRLYQFPMFCPWCKKVTNIDYK